MYIIYREDKKCVDFGFIRAQIPLMLEIREDIKRALPNLRVHDTEFEKKYGSHFFQIWDVEPKDYLYIKVRWDGR